MIGDGTTVVKPSAWKKNKVGETLVVEANQNTGMMTWTDKKSGEVVLSVENKSICTGSWRFCVTLLDAGTTIRLVTQAKTAPAKEAK